MTVFVDLADIAPHLVWEGLIARVVGSERVSFAVLELEPDMVVPEHAHDNEQIGILVRGSLAFRIGDEERDLEVGATWQVPPNVPHSVRTGPEGAVVVEVFAPGRADWSALQRAEPSTPLWPVRSGRL